jgi:hypothetical protein
VKTLIGLAALVVTAGAVGYLAAGWGSESAVSLGPAPRPTTSTQTAAQSTTLPSGRALEVWLARGGRLVEGLRTHTPTRRVANAALEALLDGPTRSERTAGIGSEIPSGTQLLGVTIVKGVARVDLSSAFEAGGSSRSLQLRLAQVVYTLTQFPTVSAVRFSVDGTPVNDRAVGRGAYKALAPSVSPLAGSWTLLPRAPIAAQADRASAWTGRHLLLLGRRAFTAYEPQRNTWRALTPPRPGHYRMAWTGKEALAWGQAALAYDGSWRPLPKAPVAAPAIVAWTGRELIGWGRSGGAAYRPAVKRWRRLPAAPFLGSAAWTGRELINVSGSRAAAFVPAKGWHMLPSPPESRDGAGAVWDGHELLVVGGDDAPTVGLAYSPTSNSWRRLAPMDSGRAHAAAVWTGKLLLLWGGETGKPGAFVIPPHGLAYDPRADRWSPLPQAPLRGRLDPAAVWTGRSLIVWGGDPGLSDGAVFSPRHP